MFDTQTYASRRAALIQALRSQGERGLCLFLGNEESGMNYADNTYTFRQDSTFLYFFGLDHPGHAALIDLDAGETTLFADDLSLDAVVWTGPQPAVADLAARVGITRTSPVAGLSEALGEALSKGRPVHTLPPYRPEHEVKRFHLLNLAPGDRSASVPFIRGVVELRAIKEEQEVREIERAADISADMHLAAMRLARPGMTEADLAAEVTRIALAAHGNLSFPVIATIHGETLHNHHHGNTLAEGDLFLLDCGAETAMHYAGDLTSTFPVSRTFSPRQKAIYDVVLAAHLAAVNALAPGKPFRAVHLLACRTLVEGLKGLGLMKGDPDEAVAQGAHAMFFQCGLGHMMGLDVHDMENLGEVWVGYEGQPKSTQFGLKSLRLARPLQPSFVCTVEPGIYLIPTLIDRWGAEGRFRDFIAYDELAKWRDFGGVRIEEDFLVTPTGARRLGKAKPRTTAEVEALRA